MSSAAPSSTAYRVTKLPQNSVTEFELRPDSAARAAIAQELDLDALRKLTFSGTIRAQGSRDWRLEGKLGASVVQPCAVTLAPVLTRIDVPVVRVYLAEVDMPAGEEVEMPEDDTVEPLGSVIDPAVVMIEALALEIPDYPRVEGAELGQAIATQPGIAPMTDEDARPFAGLADLRGRLESSRKDPDDPEKG